MNGELNSNSPLPADFRPFTDSDLQMVGINNLVTIFGNLSVTYPQRFRYTPGYTSVTIEYTASILWTHLGHMPPFNSYKL